MTIAVGKPNYSGGSSFERPPFFKLGHKQDKDRVLDVRIAPPVGELAERGVWSRFLKQHFGYTIKIPGKNGGPARDIPVTFNCIEERDRDRNIKQRCPECDEIARQKKLLEEKTKKLEAEGKSEEDIDTATRFLKSWLKDHNLDKKWHMVAKDSTSRWGFLTISHTCYKLFKGNPDNPGVLDRLVAKGLDPLGVEKGVWFRLRRTGSNWNEIKDIPDVLREERIVEGETMEVTKYDTLTDADLDQIAKLPSLETLGRPLTADQIEMLVKSGGDEETVRLVMNIPRKTEGNKGTTETKASKPAPAPADGDFEDEPAPEPAKSEKKAETKASPAPAPSAPAEDDEEAAALKALEAIKAKKAAKAAAEAAAAKAKPAEPAANGKANAKIKDDLELPMDEFLKKFENTAK